MNYSTDRFKVEVVATNLKYIPTFSCFPLCSLSLYNHIVVDEGRILRYSDIRVHMGELLLKVKHLLVPLVLF